MLDENKIKFIKFYSRLFNDKNIDKFDVILYGLIEYLSGNEKRICTASNNTLASYLDCSKRTIIRSIDKLVDYGYLKRENKQAPNNKNITHRELKPSDINDTTLVTNMTKGSDINDTLKELYKKNYIKEDIKELSNIKNSNKERAEIENSNNNCISTEEEILKGFGIDDIKF
ncbi:MAG: helix-turn-helix domain-containing protein [Thomasclavelia spiroformis]|jgi:predicted transcriptional regulator|uniref:helix-turn-helix domain-containing protein n=1 Tax=Thomasclavelia spiroformis TaxID=29348 RepID=UPI00241F147A|nr:helix-turn-helix domain-containing protein [Thomasclavelia spiroformis]